MSYLRKSGKNYTLEFYYNGRKYHRSLGVSDYKAAKTIQSKVDYDIQMGRLDPSFLSKSVHHGSTVRDLIEKWNTYISKKKLKKETKYDYELAGNLLLEILGDIDLNRIDSEMVETDVMEYMLSKFTIGSVRHFFIDFRNMFGRAVEWGMIKKNPFSGKVPGYNKNLPRYYKEEEIELLREYFSKAGRPSWQADLVFLTLNTGLRRNEVLSLKWSEHVDLEREQIMPVGKNDKTRVVPLNKEALRILKNRPRNDRDDRVFWEIKSKSAINSMWRRVKASLNLRGRFHDLRHTYASYYVMNGGSLYRLKDILGHADISTGQIYAKVAPENLHEGKNCVNFVINRDSVVKSENLR